MDTPVIAYDANQVPLGMGSGFYFRDNLIATNFHVVEGATSFLIKVVGSERKFTSKSVRSFSKNLDVAIIEATHSAPPLPVVTGNVAEVGSKVVVIGNPKGLEGSVSTGIVSGIREIGELKIYQLTAPISPGSSGGPVFSLDGRVIGIATFTLRNAQNLNFAMPAEVLLQLEAKRTKWEPAQSAKPLYRRGNAVKCRVGVF